MARVLPSDRRPHRVRLVRASAVCAVLAMMAASRAMPVSETLEPEQVIVAMHRAVLAAMAKDRHTYQREPAALYALTRLAVRPHFDLQEVSRLLLGSRWRDSPQQLRSRFVDAFERYLVTSYSKALLYVGDETISVLAAGDRTSANVARVPVRITMHDGRQVNVDVLLRRTMDGWKIWDVVAVGISYVKTYRADFGTEAAIHGIEHLIESIDAISERNEQEARERVAR